MPYGLSCAAVHSVQPDPTGALFGVSGPTSLPVKDAQTVRMAKRRIIRAGLSSQAVVMKKLIVLTMVLGLSVLTCTGVLAQDKESREQDAKVKALVEKGVALVKDKGKEAALREINKLKGPFVKGEIFLFAVSLKNEDLGGGAKSSHLVRGKDLSGLPFIRKMTKIAKEKGSGWIEYKWPKPGSETPTLKRTYFMRVPGQDFLIAGGYYLR
jgi:cytochrome c